ARELARTVETLQELERGVAQDQDKLNVLARRLAELQPEFELVRAREGEAGEAGAEAQRARAEWQTGWGAVHREAAEPMQTAQVERARIEQLERRGQELLSRTERLQREREAISPEALEQELVDLQDEEASLSERIALLDEQLDALQERYVEQRAQ